MFRTPGIRNCVVNLPNYALIVPQMFLRPPVVMHFNFFHSRLYTSADFSTSIKIAMPVVVPCMLSTDTSSSVISKLAFSCNEYNSWDVSVTSINSSWAPEKHTNLLVLSFSCDLIFLAIFSTLRLIARLTDAMA